MKFRTFKNAPKPYRSSFKESLVKQALALKSKEESFFVPAEGRVIRSLQQNISFFLAKELGKKKYSVKVYTLEDGTEGVMIWKK